MNQAAAVRALASDWAALNGTLFRGALKPPALELSSGTTRLGGWQRATRTLSIARSLVAGSPWPDVLEVLKHEMAHQYVDEVLKVHDEGPHGAAFRQVCDRIGADPRARGEPVGAEEPALLRKVRKLLALADSDNAHEAEAAAAAAHRFLRKHNLDVLGNPTTFTTRIVGRSATRHQAWEKALAGLLGQHFFVQAVWVPAWLPDRDKWGKVLELSGRPENLDLAEHVHDFVSDVGQRRWTAHKRVHGSVGRQRGRFLAGVVMGFGEQLAGQAAECEETGLVWVGDPDLDDWVGRRHPRLRAGRRVTVRGDAVWQQGRAEGRRLQLRKPVRGGRGKGVRGLIKG